MPSDASDNVKTAEDFLLLFVLPHNCTILMHLHTQVGKSTCTLSTLYIYLCHSAWELIINSSCHNYDYSWKIWTIYQLPMPSSLRSHGTIPWSSKQKWGLTLTHPLDCVFVFQTFIIEHDTNIKVYNGSYSATKKLVIFITVRLHAGSHIWW